jgi:hypothetical protein
MNLLPEMRRWVPVSALGLGILADQVVRAPGRPGVNIALWAIAGSLVLWFLSRRRIVPVARESACLVGGAVGFSLLIVLRDAEILAVFALLSAIALLGFAAGRGAIAWAGRAHFVEIAGSAVRVGALIALGPIGWNLGEARRPPSPSSNDDRVWLRRALMIGRGLAIGVLPFLLLTAILRTADPVFDRILHFALFEGLEPFLEHLFFIGLIAWFTSGYLRAFAVDDTALNRVRLPRPALAPSEMAIAISLLNLLFLSFLAVQARYLFGGAGLVEVTEGLSYAEYARRGFFELVTATALVIPMLLVADWAAAVDSSRGRRGLQLASTLLVLLLGGVLASAAFRMHLYQEAYGMTEERLLVSVFMVWLAGLLFWLALTVLRGRRAGFHFVAALGGIACIAVLHLLNPHALIARVNLERAASGAEFDEEYHGRLSADAVPTLVQRMSILPVADRCRIVAMLQERWVGDRLGGWRTWNLSDARARVLVAELQEPAGCIQLPEEVEPDYTPPG